MAGKGKVTKVCKGKSPLQLIDEEEEVENKPKPEPQCEGEEYDVERAIQMSLESFQAQGQAHVGGVAIREHVAEATRPLPVPKKTSTTDQYIFQRRIPVTEEASTGPSAHPKDDTYSNIVCDTPSPTDAETGASTDKTNSEGDTEILNISEKQGEDVADKVNLEEKTTEIDEGQAGSNPDPESMHDDFVATMYPQVHESLKHPDEEHAQVENPLSSTGTLSSMKNLDAYTFGDQFFNDKPTEEEPDKANMETEVESMVTVPIH
ncbi:hypothetical protein Tco_1155026 [Tanacetum coccineum]